MSVNVEIGSLSSFYFIFFLSKSAIAIGLWFSGLRLRFRVLDFLGSLAKLGVFSFEVVVGSNDSDHLYYFIGLFIYTTI